MSTEQNEVIPMSWLTLFSRGALYGLCLGLSVCNVEMWALTAGFRAYP